MNRCGRDMVRMRGDLFATLSRNSATLAYSVQNG